MAGSRAASAREPGQIREEAALSDTARAPRTSLAGADDRRARPGTSFEGGCTVRLPGRSTRLGRVRTDRLPSPMDDADLIRQLAERWNAGDIDGAVDLYAEDAVMVNGPALAGAGRPSRGSDGIRGSMEEWGARLGDARWSRWARPRSYGDRIVAHRHVEEPRSHAAAPRARCRSSILFTLPGWEDRSP